MVNLLYCFAKIGNEKSRIKLTGSNLKIILPQGDSKEDTLSSLDIPHQAIKTVQDQESANPSENIFDGFFIVQAIGIFFFNILFSQINYLSHSFLP